MLVFLCRLSNTPDLVDISFGVGYKKSSLVFTSTETSGYLSLPHRLSNGHCVEAPIRYKTERMKLTRNIYLTGMFFGF